MWQPDEDDEARDLTASETRERFERGEVRLLDVREADEWDHAHIPGATWIPLGQLERRFRELDPEAAWVCVCHSGARSDAAAGFLRYTGLNAVNMLGGMISWAARRYPMEQGRGGGGQG